MESAFRSIFTKTMTTLLGSAKFMGLNWIRLEFSAMLTYKIPNLERAAANGIREKYKDLRKIFVSQFVAKADGEMFLYLNDAIAADSPVGRDWDDFMKQYRRGKDHDKRAAPPPF